MCLVGGLGVARADLRETTGAIEGHEAVPLLVLAVLPPYMSHLPVPRFFVSGELVSSFWKDHRTYIAVQRIPSEPNERSDMFDHDFSEVTEQMTLAVKPCTSKFVPAPGPSVARCHGHAILSAPIPRL